MPGGTGLHGVTSVVSSHPLPWIIACLADREPWGRLRDALRDHAELTLVETLAELRDVLRREVRPIHGIVITPADRDGAAAAPFIRELTAAQPGVPIVAYCRAGIEHSPDIRALAAAGAHEFLFRGVDDSGIAFRAVMSAAVRECATDAVMRQLRPIVPKRLHSFVEYAVAYPVTAKTVSDLARMLGVHRKTLFVYCAQERFPPPSELLRWCRLFLVAQLLEHSGRTIESIAHELDLPSDTSLRNMMKRYTGMRATEVRERGGLSCLLACFVQRLASR